MSETKYLHSVYPPRPSEGFRHTVSVTPSDESNLAQAGFVYVGGYGDIVVSAIDDPADHPGETFANHFGWLPIVVRKVWASGPDGDTTATQIKLAF